MAIIYTDHLKVRLAERKIPDDYPQIIYSAPEETYFDNIQLSQISIKTLFYNGKHRKMCIAYVLDGQNVKIKTIHPETDKGIQNRVAAGRWRKR